jgi:hypothetical protein
MLEYVSIDLDIQQEKLKLEDRILRKAKAQRIVSELISLGHGHVVGDHPESTP